MKVLGEIILYYGAPFLSAAVESIYDQVDKIVILYSPKPSQGHSTTLQCPDTREDLMACVMEFKDKIMWVEGDWGNEGDHVNAISHYTEGYDWVWRSDADEVVPPGMVAEMIRQAEAYQDPDSPNDRLCIYKHHCVPFVHFWRSFSRVCRDGQQPMRLTRVNGGEGSVYLDSQDGKWVVLHFGYAQPTKYLEFKLTVSGHKDEFRPGWLENVWLKNDGVNCHPVMFEGHWNAVDFDKTTMPLVLKRHKYYNSEVIE